ncbi:MAG: glycerol kinase GlpK [Thermoproteota archaeon]|jgi:glycerol kinase
MASNYILAIDQGTTSTRSIVFSTQGEIVSVAQKEIRQIYPKAGYVEHDPLEIFNSVLETAREAIRLSKLEIKNIAAIGITNQRETVVVWNKDSGTPVYNAIVWQCRRTSSYIEELKKAGYSQTITSKTGLVPDAYFSGPKIKWILDNVQKAKELVNSNKLLFGTIDSWLLWKLTGGKVHSTDVTNASRTMLFNIARLKWDEDLFEIMKIPIEMAPEVKKSSDHYGFTSKEFLGKEIFIGSLVGDQQAALFGQTGFEEGEIKCTYGTGNFILLNTGDKIVFSKRGLVSTIAFAAKSKVNYALEGSIFITGAAIQWLRDGLGIIKESKDVNELASKVKDNGGVYFVPAFVGLGAPYWDMYARGTIIGITRGTTSAHIARATLESIAYQTRDVIEVMESETGIKIKELKVDGGASASDLLMQFQSNLLGVPILRPKIKETTALGASMLAGLSVGLWKDFEELKEIWKEEKRFLPSGEEMLKAKSLYENWKKAVERARGWSLELKTIA